MVFTDPIADMLTRIRNASMIRKTDVILPHSRIKETVATVLARNNFINGVEVSGDNGFKTLKISICDTNENSRITSIERISRPGRRVYASAKEIPMVKRGRGMVVVSTSRGIMSGSEAKKAGLGGELICKVY